MAMNIANADTPDRGAPISRSIHPESFTFDIWWQLAQIYVTVMANVFEAIIVYDMAYERGAFTPLDTVQLANIHLVARRGASK